MANEVTITCRIEHETEKAYLITEDDETMIWLPKYCCVLQEIDGIRGYVELTLPEKMAIEKGLI